MADDNGHVKCETCKKDGEIPVVSTGPVDWFFTTVSTTEIGGKLSMCRIYVCSKDCLFKLFIETTMDPLKVAQDYFDQAERLLTTGHSQGALELLQQGKEVMRRAGGDIPKEALS